MPVEEIIKELKKQDKIITEAQKEKMKLYELLENAGELETKHIKSAVRVRKSEILKINDL